MKLRYNEKLVENILRDFPEEFLGERLELLQQQPFIGGFRPDLIYTDTEKNHVIVEVQLKALDRSHLYRCLEYRDLYKEQTGIDNLRVFIFCNSIPAKYQKILKIHEINCIKITKKDFLKKLRKLAPQIKVIPAKKKIIKSKLTPNFILRNITKNLIEDNALFPPNTLLFCTSWGSNKVCFYANRNLDYQINDLIKKNNKFLSADDLSRLSAPYDMPSGAMIKTRIGLVEVCLPFEQFVTIDFPKEVDGFLLKKLQGWLKLLHSNHEHPVVDVVFDSYDYYLSIPDYTNALYKYKNKMFNETFDHYRYNLRFNTTDIISDLSILKSIRFFIDKYPNYKEEKLFDSFKVNIHIKQSHYQNKEIANLSDKIIHINSVRNNIEELAYPIDHAKIVIRFEGISKIGLESAPYFLWHIEAGHIRNGALSTKQCHVCVNPPMQANKVSKQSLKLTSKYFLHLK
jgi:hypothetical protein